MPMMIISTVFVPVQPTTREQTNPTIYGTVSSPSWNGICFTTDPKSGTPINEASYEADTLDGARRRVAEAIRACAWEPCVTNTPNSQITFNTAENVSQR